MQASLHWLLEAANVHLHICGPQVVAKYKIYSRKNGGTSSSWESYAARYLPSCLDCKMHIEELPLDMCMNLLSY